MTILRSRCTWLYKGYVRMKNLLRSSMYLTQLNAIAPMLFGTLSDSIGRRLVLSFCLGVLALACVGLALMPTDAYWLLMILRILQAAGSASTVAIGRTLFLLYGL